MSNKGYHFESEVEQMFLDLEGKTKQDPIFDGQKIARTFRVPASGMMASLPGDVVTATPWFPKQFMIECKARTMFTKKKGQIFRLDYDWVVKNEQESVKAGYVPLLMFSFKRTKTDRIWVIVPQEVFSVICPRIHSAKEISTNATDKVLFIKQDLDRDIQKVYSLRNNIVTSLSIFWDGLVMNWRKVS